MLLEEAELLRGRDTTEWLGVLALLYDELASLPVEVVPEPGPVPGVAWTRLAPVAGRLATETPPEPMNLPVGLWVLVERSRFLAERGLRDHEREFADLHAILHRYADHELVDGTAGRWAAARIGVKLERGERDGYGAYAQRADEMLRQALDRESPELLERVGALFPHSKAAARASDARIDLFLGAGAIDRAARVVIDELPEGWTPARATQREVRHLMRLAELFGEKGNPDLRATVTRALAASHPELEVRLGDGRRVRLAELARAWTPAARRRSPAPTFGPDLAESGRFACTTPYQPLGDVPPAPRGSPGRVTLLCDGWRLMAFSEGSVPEPLWDRGFGDPRAPGPDRDPLPAEFSDHVRTSPGRVHVATLARVKTFDRETGAELWSHDVGPGIDGLESSGGVVIVHQDLGLDEPARDASRLLALDAASGLVLWEVLVSPDQVHRRVLLGSGYAVLLPYRSSGEGRVLDLGTGREVARFPLSHCLFRTAACAWIEDGRVILPYFGRRKPDVEESNGLLAIDLASGGRSWHVPLADMAGGDWELIEIFGWDGGTTLLLGPVSSKSGLEPGLFALDTRLGALATSPLAEVPDARLIGFGAQRRTELTSPYLFALERPTSRDEPHVVRALHVSYGERWRTRLESGTAINAYDMAAPAVSESTVALTYVQPDPSAGSRGRRPMLLLLDKATGRHRQRLELPQELYATTARLRLLPLGDGLFVCGARLMEWMR